MTFLSRLRTALATPAIAAGDVRYRSPYAGDHLFKFVPPEWFPKQSISRELAMSVPAINRARRVTCNAIARMRLRAYQNDAPLTTQPVFLSRTDGPVSPYLRMLWTVDDLFFYGASLWAVERSTRGEVLAADRVPYSDWYVDDLERVVYRDRDGFETVPDERSVLLIPGIDGGLLNDSATIVQHASDLLATALKAAETPSAYIELHQTNQYPVTPEERDRIVADWKAARRTNGGVAFTSAGIEVKEHGSYDSHLVTDGRNAAALDVARAVGIPGTILDATGEFSMTYQNAESKNRDLIDYGLSAYMAPISARLGQDDVVPRGTAIKFDLEDEIGPKGTAGTPDDDSGSTAPQPPAAPAPAPGAGQ